MYKLRTLKEFIVNQYSLYSGCINSEEAMSFFKIVENYKKFLRCKIDINMFYPVDSEGNPMTRKEYREKLDDYKDYKESSENVFFVVEDDDKKMIVESLKSYNTIADYAERFSPILTRQALNKINEAT